MIIGIQLFGSDEKIKHLSSLVGNSSSNNNKTNLKCTWKNISEWFKNYFTLTERLSHLPDPNSTKYLWHGLKIAVHKCSE